MGLIAAYRRVLGNRALARLLFGEFVSSIGDWLYLVALLVLVWDYANDPLLLGIIGAARIVPYILLSVPAGIVADRFDRRLILLVTDIVRGAIMIVIAAAVMLEASIAVTVGLAIVATCFSAFFSPAIGAYLPSLVRDESELGPANSAWASLDNLAFFIGPAFAALLLGLGSLELAFVLNALTFGIVAVVLWRLPPGLPAGRRSEEAGASEPVTTGAATGASQTGVREALAPIARPLLGLGLLNVAVGFVFGGLAVMTVVLAVEVFRVGEAGTGLLNSAIGVGGIAGALTAGALVLRRRLGPPLLAGAFALGLGVAALGQVASFSLALAAMAFAAAGALLLEIVATTLFQRIVPDAVRGRALGGMETASVIAYAGGSFVVPVLGATQPELVLLACGVIVAVAGLGSVLLLGRFAVQQPVIEPLVRRLAEVPLFSGLPPARLEAAMAAAALVPMSEGETIIRQGEEADRFYVIGEGSVQVTQTAEDGGQDRLLRRMAEGEVFGEIGLLSGVPRTATVRATSHGHLVALEREAFLELVRAGSGLTYRLLDLHRGATAPAGERAMAPGGEGSQAAG
jgi:MFS family permease